MAEATILWVTLSANNGGIKKKKYERRKLAISWEEDRREKKGCGKKWLL